MLRTNKVAQSSEVFDFAQFVKSNFCVCCAHRMSRSSYEDVAERITRQVSSCCVQLVAACAATPYLRPG